MSAIDDIQAAAERVKAEGRSKPRVGRHPVNQPMVDHWTDAIGDKNPIYVDESAARAAGHPGLVAPPAMIQVWTMMGLGGVRPDDDPLSKILDLFDDAGYIGVVATNCEQTYHRYLRPGEEVSVAAELTDVVGPKRTALGEAFFITQTITWSVGDEDVAEMMWRILARQGTNDRLRRGVGQRHGVQLRRAPRAEGPRPYLAVRHRTRRTRRGSAHAR
jgi:acyl dehydratase